MTPFLVNPAIEFICWVFLDHGDVDELTCDRSALSTSTFKTMFRSEIPNISNKHILVVLDSCHSGAFAREALKDPLGPASVSILSSARGVCATSLVIVSENHSLLHCANRDPAIYYLILAGMLMRRFMHLIGYLPNNPTLLALPQHLNRVNEINPGFFAETHFVNDTGKGLTIQDFFPWTAEARPFHPNDKVVVGGRRYDVELVLPFVTENGLADDYSKCKIDVDCPDIGCMRVRKVRRGRRDGFEVISYGKLGENEEERRVLAHTERFRSAGTSEDPNVCHRSLRDIIDAVLRHPMIAKAGRCDRDDYVTDIDEIADVVIRVIRFTKFNFHQIKALVPYWRRHSPEVWKQLLTNEKLRSA
jgi:hypothetical protein